MGFSQPPKLESVSPDALAAVSDDELEYALSAYVADRIADAGGKFDTIERLPPKLLTWYIAYIIDVEVLNGGFNQLFFNPTGQYASEGPSVFDEIGLPEARTIMTEALELLERHAPSLEAAAEEGTLEAFAKTYLDQPFDELDSRYAVKEEVWRLARIRYVRANASTFGLP